MQGDRMWGFVLSLFLVYLYPGSLLLPGVAGMMVQLLVAVFGTLVGDWVDSSPRMRGRVTIVPVVTVAFLPQFNITLG